MENNIDTKTISAWSPRAIGWLTLFFGYPNGLILASINWLRMRLYLKAVVHFSLGLASYILLGYLYDYFAFDLDIPSIRKSMLFTVIYFSFTFLIIAYLHVQTKKDCKRIEDSSATFIKASGLSAFVITFGISIFTSIFSLAFTSPNNADFQNHVYCEILQPGMSIVEVEDVLTKEVGPFIHATLGNDVPDETPENVDSFRIAHFENSVIEDKYNLWLGLGYDQDSQLVWISRLTNNGYVQVNCPWTLRDNIQARLNW